MTERKRSNPPKKQNLNLRMTDAPTQKVLAEGAAVMVKKDMVKIMFWEEIQPGQKGPEAKIPVVVYMPPAVAKQLLGVLNSNIKKYEEKFSEIELPAPKKAEVAEVEPEPYMDLYA